MEGNIFAKADFAIDSRRDATVRRGIVSSEIGSPTNIGSTRSNHPGISLVAHIKSGQLVRQIDHLFIKLRGAGKPIPQSFIQKVSARLKFETAHRRLAGAVHPNHTIGGSK